MEFSEVYAFGHADANASSTFVQVTLMQHTNVFSPSMTKILELSPLHFALLVSGTWHMAICSSLLSGKMILYNIRSIQFQLCISSWLLFCRKCLRERDCISSITSDFFFSLISPIYIGCIVQ